MKDEGFTIKDRFLFGLAGFFGPLLIRLLGVLCRYKVEGEERLFTASREGKGVILAFWHGRMLLPIYHFRGRGICSLVSFHRDGEFITRIVTKLGYIIRRGSPRKGGREGFFSMSKDLKAGMTIAIFCDGPTGPRHHLRDGVLQLARISGAPIIPVSHSASPSWRAKSWDRFMIPKPFSRGIIRLGEPIYIPRRIGSEDEIKRFRQSIKEALIDIEKDVDTLMGYDTCSNEVQE